MKEIVIVGGARTAMAEYVGTPGFGLFKDINANELGSHAIRGALENAKVSPKLVQHVVMGNALQTSVDAIYGARHAALKAGIPIEVPALTVNRLCGSGIQSLISAAQLMQLGEAEVTVAGGMENMSQAPFSVWGLREGVRFGTQPVMQDLLFAALQDSYCGFYMAQTAENLAKKFSITREAQDEFAYRSHKLGAKAVQEGLFAEEIVPLKVKKGSQELEVKTDDHIKPDTSMEKLAKLRASFGKEGTVTAGNASGIVDGAAALILTTAERAKKEGWTAQATLRAWAVAGVDPSIMGIGPVPAIRECLKRAGLAQDKVDYFEINEAFSAQYLAVEKDLGLNREKVNVNGGAVALGHPLGATGSRLVLTLTRQLQRSKKQFGVASACIGGGQGIAILIERT